MIPHVTHNTHRKKLATDIFQRAFIGSLVLLLPVPAQAYFDPGLGSILIQSIVGAMAVVAMFWRQITFKLSRLFGRSKKESVADSRNELLDRAKESESRQ